MCIGGEFLEAYAVGYAVGLVLAFGGAVFGLFWAIMGRPRD